jgi:hypothetical protein
MSPREEIDKLMMTGPVVDIFNAEEARGIIVAIDQGKHEIARTTYASVLQTFQGYAIEQFILAVNRLFERGGRYRLRSLPALIDAFESHSNVLTLAEPHLLRRALQALGSWSDGLESMAEQPRVLEIAALLRTHMPTSKTHPALDALKALRDKALAHREHIDSSEIPRTTWEEAEQLINCAKLVLTAIGEGYLSTAFRFDDGSFGITDDALRTSNGVKRLIRHLGATDSRR